MVLHTIYSSDQIFENRPESHPRDILSPRAERNSLVICIIIIGAWLGAEVQDRMYTNVSPDVVSQEDSLRLSIHCSQFELLGHCHLNDGLRGKGVNQCKCNHVGTAFFGGGGS